MKKIFFALLVMSLPLALVAGPGHHHHHKKVDVSNTESIPSIELNLMQDDMAGWNLQIITENFEFAPQSVNKAHVLGQGHAHLYIDGIKIGRLYGAWHHIGELEKGKHTIKVSLNTNNHGSYSLNNQEIFAEVSFDQ